MKENFTDEFKREAVRLVLTSGKTQKAISKELGVSEWAISVWKKEYSAESPGNEEIKVLAEERIRQLEKENSTLRQERDILKKAMGIVSK